MGGLAYSQQRSNLGLLWLNDTQQQELVQKAKKVRRSNNEYGKYPKKRCRMTQTGKLAASWPVVLLIVVVIVTMLTALNGCKSSETRREAEPPACCSKAYTAPTALGGAGRVA